MTHVEKPAATRWMPLLWVLWVMVSVAPLLAYATPLWNNLLADTPIADLIWIPIIALGWTIWNIRTGNADQPDDGELNLILGGMLSLITAIALVLTPERWPTFFVHDHAGLLLWPFWILAMSWLFWGLSSTRRLLSPLIYLLLVWPPIFEGLANMTQSVLVRWAIDVLTLLAHHVTWLSPAAATGTFTVVHHAQSFLVVVAQACSGADSLLGAAIIIPVMWFVFPGPIRSKIWLSAIALMGALALNWVRLAVIVLAVHIIGPHFTFSYIHPVLGFILFAILAVGLTLLFEPFGLQFPRGSHDNPLHQPGWGRLTLSVVLSGAIVMLLWPLFSLPQGSFGNPLPVASYNVRTFLPSLPGFTQNTVYYANESSVLGLGSATQAELYTLRSGSGQALVEMWSTPNATRLATYGFHACLLYHGDSLQAVTSFQLVPGVIATAYAVKLPPNYVGGPRQTYVDIEWNDAASVHGHIRYMRWSIAAFPNTPPASDTLPRSPLSLRPLSPVQAMVAPAARGQWNQTILPARSTLVAMAHEIFTQSLKAGAHG